MRLFADSLQHAREVLRLTPDVALWLNGDELFQFFYKEARQYQEG